MKSTAIRVLLITVWVAAASCSSEQGEELTEHQLHLVTAHDAEDDEALLSAEPESANVVAAKGIWCCDRVGYATQHCVAAKGLPWHCVVTGRCSSTTDADDAHIDDPATEDPTLDDPPVIDPVDDPADPTLDDPTLDDPSLDEPSSDDPSSDDPTLDDPTLDDPTYEEAAAEATYDEYASATSEY